MATQKKSRKVGRSKRNGHALRYRNENRRERNKVRDIMRHLKNHPHDMRARLDIVRLSTMIGVDHLKRAERAVEACNAIKRTGNKKPGYGKWLNRQCGFKKGGTPHVKVTAS